MAVQSQGAIPARSDAQFSTSSTGQYNRAPDLVLRPYKEGIDFTIRLVEANRMSKVVEIRCDLEEDDDDDDDDDDEKKTAHNTNSDNNKNQNEELTVDDIQNLFRAIGGNTGDENVNSQDDEDDDGDLEDIPVTDEYQPSNSHPYTGLPHLESLAVIGREATPSFIEAITSFLGASTRFPRFTRLSLQGVNLRGGTFELRGFSEALRIHPNIQNVNMVSCWFTPEQQTNMNYLEDVFQPRIPGQPKENGDQPNVNAQCASIKHMKQLMLQHQPPQSEQQQQPKEESTPPTGSVEKKQSLEVETTTTEATNEGGWLQRLIKSCLCCW